jgi:hypothetical protein
MTKYWITKFALEEAVKILEVDEDSSKKPYLYFSESGDVVLKNFSIFMFEHYLEKDDWHTTREAAVERAEQMRQEMLKVLENRMNRIKGLEF